MSKYWSTFVHELSPYTPGEQPKMDNLVKLNTNENPYGPSPKVLAAIESELNEGLRLYPDPNGEALKQAIADDNQLSPNQVFLGNGSDEVLAHAFLAFFKQDYPLLFPDITYSFYPVYCNLYNITYDTIPVDEMFEIRIADYINRPNGGIIFPNPNAPTGILLPLDAIEQLLQHNTESVVVVDEAYIDFGGETAVSLINKYPNLLVIQTFSKSRSLAGLRLGFAMGDAHLIEALERVKNSFNSYPLDRLAIVGGVAAIKDTAYFEETCQKVIHQRDMLVEALEALKFRVLPSSANFVFVRHPHKDAEWLADHLRAQGVIVRYFNKARINQFLRITVGTYEQNQQLVDKLAGLLATIV